MNTVAIFGVGLIGGSFALALRKAGFSGRIIGVSSPETIRRALELSVIDEGMPAQNAAEIAEVCGELPPGTRGRSGRDVDCPREQALRLLSLVMPQCIGEVYEQPHKGRMLGAPRYFVDLQGALEERPRPFPFAKVVD